MIKKLLTKYLINFLIFSFILTTVVFAALFGVNQPIEFPHRKHIEKVGLDCKTCHPYVYTGRHAGLPDIQEVCMMCHVEKQTDSKEEEKIRQFAKQEEVPEFKKLFKFPNHVYYSHRMHVKIAGLECSTCHGDIAKTTAPPAEPLVDITMDFCIDCHKQEKVTTDCIACHI